MHCIHAITPTISSTAFTVSVSSQPLYVWSLNICIYHITPSLYMTSYAPYIRHIHSLSSQHCSNHIISTAFMTSNTLYTPSHTWQHRSYICHLTLYISHFIHCLCVIKPSVSIVLHTLSVWHHIQYAWHHMNTLWHHTCIGTSHAVYLWHIQYIWNHPYCFMKTKQLYLASQPLYLTSQLSHLFYQCLQHNYGSLHTWHTYDIIHTLHHIKFRHFGINRQYWGHHKHCILHIRSPIGDITYTVYDISSPIPVTSQPLYR